MNRSRADTVIARPLLPNSRNLPAAMAPPLLKRQKSALLNKFSESDRAPSRRALVLPNKSSGDQNIRQPKASSDQNVPQHQKATFEVAKRFMEAMVFTKTPWTILSDDKYSMVEESSKPAIEAQHRQRALAGAPVGTPSVCQLPGGPSFEIDPQTGEAVSVQLCLMLLYQTYGYWLPRKCTLLKLNISTIWRRLVDGARRTVVPSDWLDVGSETEHQMKVKELLFDDAYLSKVVDDKKSWFTWMEVLDLIYHQFSSPPIAWDASQQHHNISNLLLLRL